MDEELKISYDPEADALYITVKTVPESELGPTEVDDAGVIVDTDISGEHRGYEFLNVRTRGVPLHTLPQLVSTNIDRFIGDGYLNAKNWIEVEYLFAIHRSNRVLLGMRE
jgi:uncharacterized protein YuzE